MYICNSCNEVFLHPDYTTEREHHIDHYYDIDEEDEEEDDDGEWI